MPFRVARTEEGLARLGSTGLWRPPAAVAGLLEEARGLPEPDELVVCHGGDLHLRHLLVSDAGDLAGVIDWIDGHCRGDAAIDLLLYWGSRRRGGGRSTRSTPGRTENGCAARPPCSRSAIVGSWRSTPTT